ncbi:MAG: MarR family transcriptional regulator [Bauldia sp.]
MSALIILRLMDATLPSRNINFLIHDVARLLKRAVDRRAALVGFTRAQWHVLAVLKSHEGLKQSQIADLIEVEPITLSRQVDRLERAGLVERRADPDDRRAYRLYLGPEAEPVLKQMRAMAGDVSCLAHAGVSEAEIEILVAALTRMRANLAAAPPAAEASGEEESPRTRRRRLLGEAGQRLRERRNQRHSRNGLTP